MEQQKSAPTTIKLEKEETLTGETWYYVYIDTKAVQAFLKISSDPNKALKEATNLYHEILGRLQSGFPKKEIIFSSTYPESGEPGKDDHSKI